MLLLVVVAVAGAVVGAVVGVFDVVVAGAGAVVGAVVGVFDVVVAGAGAVVGAVVVAAIGESHMVIQGSGTRPLILHLPFSLDAAVDWE